VSFLPRNCGPYRTLSATVPAKSTRGKKNKINLLRHCLIHMYPTTTELTLRTGIDVEVYTSNSRVSSGVGWNFSLNSYPIHSINILTEVI
jgi:hypothetical protein